MILYGKKKNPGSGFISWSHLYNKKKKRSLKKYARRENKKEIYSYFY